ncbi:MAG: class I SAM-dependent methyltransferase [Ignavibacteria bacterium]|nr:class I SAM-dependent methyltransferase [Ignavibacteria bacterium]
MENENLQNFANRNFSTISLSAKWLLLMKGHTDIPYARHTAELIQYPEKFIPDFDKRDYTFWARTVHFEARYKSVNQLLDELSIKNILEISSGCSFRSLEKIKEAGFYYIDTDLPDMIESKKEFIKELQNGSDEKGKLELLPLNALDEEQFSKTVNRFPAGEIVILNEGLLMYLSLNEKEQLCRIIHKILKERGGYWITADIYLKSQNAKLGLKFDEKTKDFFDLHNTEENRFESFDEAEAFFGRMGFVIDKESKSEQIKLSSLKYLLGCASQEQLLKIRSTGKIQSTWRLRIAD